MNTARPHLVNWFMETDTLMELIFSQTNLYVCVHLWVTVLNPSFVYLHVYNINREQEQETVKAKLHIQTQWATSA